MLILLQDVPFISESCKYVGISLKIMFEMYTTQGAAILKELVCCS